MVATDRIRAVLLDIDGTLVDSNDAHARAWVEALREHGQDVPFDRVRPLIGMGGDTLLPRVAGIESESPEGTAIDRRRAQLVKERYGPTLRACPGTRALLERLRDAGLRLIVATSAKEDELDGLLARTGAADLLRERVSSSEVDAAKPAPDIIQAALEKLDLPAEAVVLLGDTPYDIEAAARAGVRTIALRCGGWDDRALAGALAVYEHPADLLAHLDESPLGRRP